HPTGRGKARFFVGLGFSAAEWPVLQAALVAHARCEDVSDPIPNPFGRKFIVRGMMEAPQGRAAHVVSVWIILQGEDWPRLLTAYPGDSI
ncbi:MAG: DUF6883 domain-containing protein, partial [Gemmatimonadaceae bacterium]